MVSIGKGEVRPQKGEPMKTIKLTDEQYDALYRLLLREWDQEWLFQIDGDKDTEWLEEYYSLYEAMFQKPKSIIDVMVNTDILAKLRKEIKEVKQ